MSTEPRGIRVNVICPGFIVTEIMAQGAEDFIPDIAAKAALNRAGESHEVAEVGAFLASDRASFVTGAVIPVDGAGPPSWPEHMTPVPVTEEPPIHAPRRQYDSTLRRQRAAETRARIIAASSELLHSSSVRDWHGLTIRAVAEKAGINERTVYRHFVNEQGLRDAVMHEFEEEAGIDLRGMRLEDVADVTARIFAHVSSYPSDARQPLDPTLLDAKRRQHDALHAAVAAHAAHLVRAGPHAGRGRARRAVGCRQLRTHRRGLAHGPGRGDPGHQLGD